MRLYFFMVIALGLMYTFSLAGIDTGSNAVIERLGMNSSQIGNTVVVEDVGARSESADTASGIINKDSWWNSLTIALAVILFLGGISAIRAFGTGLDINAIITSAMAGVAITIFVMFAVDFFSILIYMREITGGIGWEFHLTWILIVPFLFAFGFTIIKFIQGTAD